MQLDELFPELLLLIASFLDAESRAALRRVAHTFWKVDANFRLPALVHLEMGPEVSSAELRPSVLHWLSLCDTPYFRAFDTDNSNGAIFLQYKKLFFLEPTISWTIDAGPKGNNFTLYFAIQGDHQSGGGGDIIYHTIYERSATTDLYYYAKDGATLADRLRAIVQHCPIFKAFLLGHSPPGKPKRLQ
jgi:hypothetical protein